MYHPFSISAWSVTSTTRPETTLLGPVPLARVHLTGFRGGAWLDPRTETRSKGRRIRIAFNIHRMFSSSALVWLLRQVIPTSRGTAWSFIPRTSLPSLEPAIGNTRSEEHTSEL